MSLVRWPNGQLDQLNQLVVSEGDLTGRLAASHHAAVRAAERSGLVALLLVAACEERLASETIDYEALKEDACERACSTMDACGEDFSEVYQWPEPTDCFTRCITLLPQLHEENQCGSRKIIGLRCLGELDCDGYAAFKAGQALDPPDFSAPCVSSTYTGCSIYDPFDLDEIIPVPDASP